MPAVIIILILFISVSSRFAKACIKNPRSSQELVFAFFFVTFCISIYADTESAKNCLVFIYKFFYNFLFGRRISIFIAKNIIDCYQMSLTLSLFLLFCTEHKTRIYIETIACVVLPFLRIVHVPANKA